jgi:hypothetical protein
MSKGTLLGEVRRTVVPWKAMTGSGRFKLAGYPRKIYGRSSNSTMPFNASAFPIALPTSYPPTANRFNSSPPVYFSPQKSVQELQQLGIVVLDFNGGTHFPFLNEARRQNPTQGPRSKV